MLPGKVDSFKCDSDCGNYKSLGVCSHTVAVANLNGKLPGFVAQLRRAKKKPNLMKLAVHGMPSGRPSRKRATRSTSVQGRVQRIPVSLSPPTTPFSHGMHANPAVQESSASSLCEVSSPTFSTSHGASTLAVSSVTGLTSYIYIHIFPSWCFLCWSSWCCWS